MPTRTRSNRGSTCSTGVGNLQRTHLIVKVRYYRYQAMTPVVYSYQSQGILARGICTPQLRVYLRPALKELLPPIVSVHV